MFGDRQQGPVYCRSLQKFYDVPFGVAIYHNPATCEAENKT